MNTPARGWLIPAPLLVFGGVLSVQFGGALAATMVPQIGAGGAVHGRPSCQGNVDALCMSAFMCI